MANRWGIPKNVEEIVKERDLHCVYCGIIFTNPALSFKSKATWEHIVNDIKINGSENIALCCGSCNASKGSKQLEAWLLSKYCLAKGITMNSVSTVVKEHLKKQLHKSASI